GPHRPGTRGARDGPYPHAQHRRRQAALAHGGQGPGRPVARGELRLRGPDLPHGQPAAARAAAARARQATPPRALGHDARAQLRLHAPQPGHPRARPGPDVRVRSRARWTGGGGRGVPRRHLQRALPRGGPRRAGPAPALHPVLVPGRDPQPRGTRDARVHPRGRRARLRPVARVRRRLRQPRPRRGGGGRRRRGGDRAAGDLVALHQVRRPAARRCRPADPPPQRLQDRQPDRARPDPPRGARRPAARPRPHAVRRGGRRPDLDAPGLRRHPGPLPRRDPRAPGRGAGGAAAGAPSPLADDRAALPQGLDGAEGGGRPAGRGVLAVPPGAVRRRPWRRRPPARAGDLDAQLSARRALRRLRRPVRAGQRAVAVGRAPDERQPARQRRHPAAGAAHAGLPGLRGRGARSRHRRRERDPGARRLPARRDGGERRPVPDVQPRRAQLQPAPGRAGGDRAHVERAHRAVRHPPGARRAGDGDAVGAHVPGVARGLPPDRPARPLLLLRGVRPHRRLDVQPARQVAQDQQRPHLAPADRLPELPAHLARLAAGPQRLLPPGPGVHRPRDQQEGRRGQGLPAAGRQHPALRGRPLPAQPAVRQRHGDRQAARAAVPVHGRGRRPRHQGHRHLGVGQHPPRRRAGGGDGVRRRGAHHGGAGGRRHPARPLPRPADPLRQRRGPDAAPGRPRAPARALGQRLRRPVHHRQAGDLRLPRLSVAHPPADLPAAQPPQPPRPRLRRGGHHHDALRHDRPQPAGPLRPRHGRHRPGAAAARGLGVGTRGPEEQAGRAPHPRAHPRRGPARGAGLELVGGTRAGGHHRGPRAHRPGGL
ncbi:MAG: Xylulose-5-phosphate phosphoketolase @ Fructose-6-phosphate phosphoketolase, partial [uncultured Nocardioides sp.]